MINIDNVEKFVTEELAQGERFSLRKEGWIELITRLRQAEKDAARYRWLRDECRHEYGVDDLFDGSPDSIDKRVDTAMIEE
ncbi:MAG: hypothetical protein ACRCXB_34750 [Aeromonadaceae bacterium]